METRKQAYGGGQKWLHWVVALLVFGLVPVGIAMGRLPEGPLQDSLFNLHRSFGMLVLVLVLARLALRFHRGTPANATGLTRFETAVSKATHLALYVLLLAVPLIGWLGMSAYGGDWSVFGLFKPPGLIGKSEVVSERLFVVHMVAALFLGVLALLHVGAAFMHRFIKKDTVMARMLPSRREPRT